MPKTAMLSDVCIDYAGCVLTRSSFDEESGEPILKKAPQTPKECD